MNSLLEFRSKVLLGFIDQALKTTAESGILRSLNGYFRTARLIYHVLQTICHLFYIYLYKSLLWVSKLGTLKLICCYQNHFKIGHA